MLPFFGPSSVRDTPGLAVDMFTDGSHYIEEDKVRYSLLGLEILDLRVSLFPLDETLAGTYDPYAFIRNAYLQRREYLVKDGAIEEEPLEDPEFEDPEPEDPAAGPAPDAARVDQHSEQTAMAVAAPEGAT
jgi:phospholipid-binding lipoprotein MlaA